MFLANSSTLSLKRHWARLAASDISGQLPSDWPPIPVHDLWPQYCIILWSLVIVCTRFGCQRVYLSNLTSCWPQMNPTRPLTPAMHHTWWSYRAFLSNLTPYMIFDLINALHYNDRGFFLPNLVAIRHSCAVWPLVDPSWPTWPLIPGMY